MTAPNGGWNTPTQQQAPQLTDQFGRPIQAPQQGGFPQQQAPQQGFPQQGAPQQQFQPAQGGPVDLNMRLTGPNVPQELQGKTMAEALRYYGVMRQDFIQRNTAQRQQGAQQPQQGQPQQFQPQQSLTPQPQNQWGQPQFQQQAPPPMDLDAVNRVANEAAQRAMAPLTGVSIATVYNTVRARFADWGQFDAGIQESLQGADQSTLLNPEVWSAAYYHAKGRAMSQQQQPQFAQQPQGAQQPLAYENGEPVYGYQGSPQNQQPTQNFGQLQQVPVQPQYPQQQAPQPYFVEGPTPQLPQGLAQTSQHASQHDVIMARKFGISLEAYMAGKNGAVPPVQQAPQQQQFKPQQQGQPQYGNWQQPQQQQQFQSPYPPQQQFIPQPPMNGGYYGR